jgi:hypothetical protein
VGAREFTITMLVSAKVKEVRLVGVKVGMAQ